MARNRSAVVLGSFRFAFGLALVTVGAGVFAVAFRASLTALYEHLYGAENVVGSIAILPAWMRLRATACRVASSWVAIAGGLSIGREGP